MTTLPHNLRYTLIGLKLNRRRPVAVVRVHYDLEIEIKEI